MSRETNYDRDYEPEDIDVEIPDQDQRDEDEAEANADWCRMNGMPTDYDLEPIFEEPS